VLTNFGLSPPLQAHLQGAGEDADAKPAYMSPEQFRREDVSHLSDIYSLGAILYEMLCGSPPFNATAAHSPSATPGKSLLAQPGQSLNIHASVAQAVGRAMSKDPRARFQRAVDLADELQLAIGLEPILCMSSKSWTVSPAPPTLKMKAPPRTQSSLILRLTTILLGIILLAALAILAYVTLRNFPF
jgi:serine/threonine-protein kinase